MKEGRSKGLTSIFIEKSISVDYGTLVIFWLPFLGYMMHEALNNLEYYPK